MVTIPQGQNQPETTEVVQLSEESDIICALLDFIYPRRSPPRLHPFSFVLRLSEAADKYDISAASHYIRERLTKTAITISGSALEQYALACRFGWINEARYLSQFTTLPNTRDVVERSILETLDAPSVVKLLNLHQRRSSSISSLTISYTSNNVAPEIRERQLHWENLSYEHHLTCRSQAHDRNQLFVFKLFALSEMERVSLEDCLSGFRPGFWSDSRLNGFWDDQCTKCSGKFFYRDSFAREFTRVMCLLPKIVA
ncbi:hypothetical protein ACEPAH_3859 [Sanghuangporus vaninii]